MAKELAHPRRLARENGTNEHVLEDGIRAARARILQRTSEVRILDPEMCRDLVQRRQERGIDRHDEVWDGVYVVPPLASNPHQLLVGLMCAILHDVIGAPGKGQVLPGANVSDRREGWEHNYRDPDVVVTLEGGRAVDCTTHYWGGPDFLIEIQSPGDDTDEKIPFYSALEVRELLIIHRDTRELRLYRHDGEQLAPVEPSEFQGKKWLVSEVLPLAFRRKAQRGGPRTEVRRTDRKPGHWTV
jgi:Uma2 family endonuclease